MKAWLLALRPKTLTAALVPVLVGTALAYAEGAKVRVELSFFALLSALCIQIGTNLINDALDFKKGTDTADRLGPLRVSQGGLLSHKKVMWGAAGFFLAAILFAWPLIVQGGMPILVVGVISIFCAYIYTGGPYPLAYHGLGELFVILFFGWVATCGMFYIQIGRIDSWSVLAGFEVGLLSTVLIAINNFRDIAEDERNQKNTLAVRFGSRFARSEIVTLSIAPFALNLLWFGFLSGSWALALGPFLSLPLAVKVARGVNSAGPGRHLNLFLSNAAGLHLFFGLILSMALIWLGRANV